MIQIPVDIQNVIETLPVPEKEVNWILIIILFYNKTYYWSLDEM